jgi:uncharacterized glyoxalase superfamily protein PhnB
MPARIPAGRNAVMPYIAVADAQSAVDFAVAVFDAEIVETLRRRDGSLWNVELRIAGSTLLIAEAQGFGPYPAFLYVYVEDCDAVYRRALDAGAEPVTEPADQFYGDRNGGVRDPAGNIWWIASMVEEVPSDELHRRAAALEESRAQSGG